MLLNLRRLAFLFFILISLPVLYGCDFYGPEELDRLMKEDPAFRQMIAARDQAHSRIRTLKQDLLVRKKDLDAQVDKLRASYDAYAKGQNQQIEKYMTAIEGYREQMKRELAVLGERLVARTAELNGYEKTLSDVKRVIRESKGIKLTSSEKQKWEERVLMLSEKIRPLKEEIQDIKLQIRLKKQKLSFLK
jgi:chromosome segregation ATPase